MKLKNFAFLMFWILLPLFAGFLGSIATYPNIPTWYAALNKPSFNPPNWIFGPVWTTLYILMGWAAYLISQKGWKNKEVKIALTIFIAQLALNILWSFIFFGQHLLLVAFIEIIILWLFILWTILKFYPLSKLAAWLLMPYILWVSFASFLNLSIWMIN